MGATAPADANWGAYPRGYRRFERSVLVGRGSDSWERASSLLIAWGVKTRSGFAVEPAPAAPVSTGSRVWLVARIGVVRVREPVVVVAVVDEPGRRGFAYGTLEGHPVAGEEAFVLHRASDGTVWLTLRSLTRAATGPRCALLPVALLAQRFYRWRYLRALRRS
ncbi:uncharacterized protein (UPF0548 family) [Motilibacter peucedani]|uniref:Uncharacterized protein (UPF0548 family) n=1 Tax=Motilibacter peucedani TaxID=598650 RepID=A0A420XMH5_9ACTN|nr:uncharacterized protein (UPF0548 family) [Motilibacter peucedani]